VSSLEDKNLVSRSLSFTSTSMSHHEEAVTFISMDNVDDHTEVGRLQKVVKHLQEENQRLTNLQPKRGNPAVIGLAGFGATTLLLQFHNLGWIGVGGIVWLGIIFGGLAQLIAGLMEFATGNNFGFCAFTTYGSFWISLSAILISKQLKLYPITDQDIGAFLLVFTIMTLILWIASGRISMGLFVTFALLFTGFVLLDVSHLADVKAAEKAAAIVLILCALAAWYCMCHIIFLEVNKGKDLLPLGPSPYALVFERKSKSKAAVDISKN